MRMPGVEVRIAQKECLFSNHRPPLSVAIRRPPHNNKIQTLLIPHYIYQFKEATWHDDINIAIKNTERGKIRTKRPRKVPFIASAVAVGPVRSTPTRLGCGSFPGD